jgi:DNA-binding protein HU-beta
MNKADLIDALAQAMGQRADAEKVVNKFIQILRDTLRKGDKVVLTGIGSFYPKIRKAQKRHNPKTMEPVTVPPKRIVKFIASEELFESGGEKV